jgi:hypothetical protein
MADATLNLSSSVRITKTYTHTYLQTPTIVTALYGFIASGIIVAFGWMTRQDRSAGYYSTVLAVIALVYVLFAAMDGSPTVLWVESGIAAAFIGGAVAAQRVRRYAFWILAGGLVLHGGYDLVHDRLVQNSAVPDWWPLFCGVIDIALGLWTARLAVLHSDKQANARD